LSGRAKRFVLAGGIFGSSLETNGGEATFQLLLKLPDGANGASAGA
jgi:hypothetical protein